jgi:thiaminase
MQFYIVHTLYIQMGYTSIYCCLQLSRMLKGVHEELRLHANYAVSWGVDLSAVVPSPATRAYTDFLMDVANDTSTVSGLLRYLHVG